MKPILTISIFLFLSITELPLQADNWEFFPLNQKTYFLFEKNSEKTIVPYYVDFEEEEGVYMRQYPLRTYIEEVTGGCYEEVDLNIGLGIPVGEVAYNPHLVKGDGYFAYIYEIAGVTGRIDFYPQANIGESWESEGQGFEDHPFLYTNFKITCIDVEWKSVLSVMDSVKTFEIKASNGLSPGKMATKKFSIELSKQHGLVKWFGFNEWVFSELTTSITIAGIEDENGNIIGESTPKAADFYPYTASSVLKWKENYWVNGGRMSISHVDSILSVEKTDLNIQYAYNRTTKTEYMGEITEETKLNEELSIDFFPQHFIDLVYWNFGMKESSYYTLDLQKLTDEDGRIEYVLTTLKNATFFNNCRVSQFVDFGTHSQIFSTKFGLQKEYEGGGFNGSEYNIELQEAFVEEDYFTSIEANKLPPLQLKFYPNPAQDHFVIEASKPNTFNKILQLQITNLQGKTVLQTTFNQAIEVSLADFPNGIYLLQVSNGDNKRVEKIVKH